MPASCPFQELHADIGVLRQVKARNIVEVDFDALSTKNQSLFVIARTPDPKDPLTKRSPVDVPFMEVVAAVANVVEIGHSVEMAEVEDQVVRKVFGFDRVTAQWRDLIDGAIENLIADNWCTITDGRIAKALSFPE